MTSFKKLRGREEHISSSPPLQNPPENPSPQKFLWGRKLLFEECQTFSNIDRYIQNSLIKSEPGIILSRCSRCDNTDPELFGSYHCARCDTECQYCRACLTMGTIKSCSQLLTWIGPSPDIIKMDAVDIHWSGELSPLQQKASSALQEALRTKQDFLIWAVTGAGKTEILYETIRDALTQGLRVGIVSPRTDVIIELSRRIKGIFSDVPSVILYGDSPDEYQDVPLILSTTHQLLRFDHRFDVFFIDEVDAFPFHNNSLLEKALVRAGKSGCLHFYLTATPTHKMKQHFKSGNIHGVKIPVRFHGHPLPEPRFQWLWSWKKQINRGIAPPGWHIGLKNTFNKNALLLFSCQRLIPRFASFHYSKSFTPLLKPFTPKTLNVMIKSPHSVKERFQF
jgi:competence protein ComFA